MFSELIAGIADQYEKNLPFVSYRKPNEAVVHAIFQEDTRVHLAENFRESGFVFAPFDDQKAAVILKASQKIQANYPVKNLIAKKVEMHMEAHELQKNHHLNLVKKGIANINTGGLKKVVLSRRVEIACEKSPLQVFEDMLAIHKTAFCYLWHHPEIGTWLGATPEILLQAEQRKLVTMSLAGTKKYVENTDPKWEQKEKIEQQLVTDYITNALTNVVSNLKIEARESVRAGNLWHLRTKLTADFKKEQLEHIIEVLHPTPAVCGLPMRTAKAFILENEGYEREYYTGFLGEINVKSEIERASSRRNQENKAYRAVKNTTTLFVNLRCMKWQNGKVYVYVGGGVTIDSDAEKEWLETIAKSNTMLQVIHANS